MCDNIIDIHKILDAIDNEDNEKFMSLNKQLIQKYKNQILQQLQLESKDLKLLHQKLQDYRYIDDLADIKYGAFIRWINITNPDKIKLTNGGVIIDVNFYEDGVQIKCKNNINRFFCIKFDDCLIFQKLTQQEKIILEIMEHLRK